jgi:glycosyltransferase involved in cell wall biosynthesis
MLEKKSVLFSPSHFIFSDSLGSEYNEAYLLIKNVYESEEYDITTICGSTHLLYDNHDYSSIEVWKKYSNHNTNNFTLKDSLIFNLKYTLETFRQIYFTRNQYDIIHHIRPFTLFSTFNFALIFNFRRIPVIIGPFGAPYKSKRKGILNKILRFLNYLTLRSATTILVNDDETKTQIEEFIGKKSVRVFPVGKDIHSYKYKEKTYEKNEFHFLSSGQLIGRKNFKFLLDGFAVAIKKSDKKLTLHIIGDGYKKQLLISQAKELGIEDRVVFHGKIPFGEIENWYQTADYFLLTPKEEAFAHVYIEAAGYGLPAITTSTVASRAIVGDVCGLISPQKDIKGFAQNIVKLTSDPILSKKLSESSRDYAIKTFDWNSVLLPKLIEIYDSILEK